MRHDHFSPLVANARRSVRAGITMTEILLALGVMILCTLLAGPVIQGAFDIHRLKDAARLLRDACAEARINAVGKGQIYTLRFQPETPHYLFEPAPQADADLALDLTDSFDSAESGDRLRSAGEIDWDTEGKSLPDGAFFVMVENQEPDEAEATLLPAAATVEQKPLLFYPDGTTSTATIVLRSNGGRYIEVKLQGLTGGVHIEEPYKTKEVPSAPQLPGS